MEGSIESELDSELGYEPYIFQNTPLSDIPLLSYQYTFQN